MTKIINTPSIKINNSTCQVFGNKFKPLNLSLFLLFLFCLIPLKIYASPNALDPSIQSGRYSQELLQGGWKIKILDAAIVRGDTVLLGEIAEPLGAISPQDWEKLAYTPLWAAPTQTGRPFQINKQRLLGALRQYLGMYADHCILPNSLAIQRGGAVIEEDALRNLILQRLAPQINSLGGHGDLTDFRLPTYIFIAHASQNLILEPTEVKPGRITLRLGVQEIDGSILKRFSASVFLNLWVNAPTLNRPMNKGEQLTANEIVYKSVNLAYQHGEIWDGRGGPWQLSRSLGTMDAITVSDLQALAAVHKGDKVYLIYEKNNVRLSVVAEAMEEGGLGDLILVKNVDSKRQVYGMIRDENTVIAK